MSPNVASTSISEYGYSGGDYGGSQFASTPSTVAGRYPQGGSAVRESNPCLDEVSPATGTGV
jgi:hypothetical protein